MNMSIYIENPNQQGFWDKNVSSIFKDIVSLYVFSNLIDNIQMKYINY